jgi:hypothetical protein
METTQTTCQPLSKEEYRRIGVGEHPVTIEQVVMVINGKLAGNLVQHDCFMIMALPYYYGEDEVRAAVELFNAAGWRITVYRDSYIRMPDDQKMRNWRLDII